MSKKTNVRSFRYSDEVKKILEGFQGASLNDKFENLVIYCHSQAPIVEKRLKYLDDEIIKKQKTIADLGKEINRINNFKRELDYIEQSVKSAAGLVKT